MTCLNFITILIKYTLMELNHSIKSIIFITLYFSVCLLRNNTHNTIFNHKLLKCILILTKISLKLKDVVYIIINF